jgi:hypothetical protein
MLIVPRGFDAKKYELIEYDYLVRIQNWNGIIAKAEKKMPDLPMSVCATNLALAMTNQLGDRAFDFYQHGSEGLLPKFERNFATTQLTGEVYFWLGLVNTAQRFAFEAMEAIPNYNKSASGEASGRDKPHQRPIQGGREIPADAGEDHLLSSLGPTDHRDAWQRKGHRRPSALRYLAPVSSAGGLPLQRPRAR